MPTKLTMVTSGISTHGGTISTFTNSFTRGTFITRSTMLARKRLAIRPQTISGCSANKSGPGVMFSVIGSASITAVVPDPGTPSVSIGIIAPPAAALLPASGAATPRGSPLPKLPFEPMKDFSAI